MSLDKIRCDTFLNQLHLPQLPRTDSSDLDGPILLEEVQKAAKAMHKGKSPGTDGIPPEFCYFLGAVGPISFGYDCVLD